MPVNTSVRLDLEPLSAIMARVAYRLIERDYRNYPGFYSDPARGVSVLAAHMMGLGFPALSVNLAAFAYHLRKGVSTAAYKQRVVRRARWARMNKQAGKPWARVPEK